MCLVLTPAYRMPGGGRRVADAVEAVVIWLMLVWIPQTGVVMNFLYEGRYWQYKAFYPGDG